MRTRTYLLPVCILLLLGCNSFNRLNYTQLVVHPPQLDKEVGARPATVELAEPTTQEVHTDTPLMCPPYVFPNLPPVPELPLKELAKVAPSNMKALDAIQQKHIEDLRAYISATRKLIRFSHEKYIEDCVGRTREPAEK